MKREHGGGGDDYGIRNKRPKADGFSDAIAAGKYELRILVNSKCAGAVIGKGGENIKRLRVDFEGQVSVPDSNSPERIVYITSAPETVALMVQDMLARLDEGNERGKRELRLLVHQSHAGALIGRGGSKIKELREKSGSNIKIYQNPAPQSTDRVCLISGDDDHIVNAVRQIIEELKEVPIKGGSSPYNTFNYDPNAAQDYGGFSSQGFTPAPGRGGGRGGAQGGNHGMSGGGYGGGPQMMRGGTAGTSYGGHGNQNMMGMGPPPMPVPPPQGYIPGMGGMQMPPPGGPGMGGQMYGGGRNNNYGAPNFGGGGGIPSTQQVTIPSDLGGTIIGRNGERINRIREESGANIILEPPNGQPERIITISGTENQIHAAQYLLQQAVRTSAQGQKYYNQQGGSR